MNLAGGIERLREGDALALASLLWFMVQFLRYVLPPLFDTFRGEYGVTTGELGLAFTALMVGYAAVQFPAGWLSDRAGKVTVIAGGAVLFSVAAFLVAGSSTWVGLVAGIVLVGVGTGVHKTVAIPMLSVVYPRTTGRALGVMDTVGQFGGVVGPAAVVFVAARGLDWRTVFLVSAGVGVVLSGAFFVRGRRRMAVVEAEDDSGVNAAGDDGADSARATGASAYLAPFRRPRFVAFVGVTVLFSFAWNGVSAFLPLYLTDAAGLSPEVAGLLFSAFFAVSAVQPVTGALGDRFGSLAVMTVALGISGVAVVGLLLVSGAVAAGICVVGVGAGMHGYRPVRDSYLTELIPDEVAGGTLGVVRTVMILLGSTAPLVVGVVVDATDFTVAFAGLGGALVAAVAGLGALWVADPATGRGASTHT